MKKFIKGDIGAQQGVVYGVTISRSANAFLLGQLDLLAGSGTDLHLVYGTDSLGPVNLASRNIRKHVVKVRRSPNVMSDVAGLFDLFRLLGTVRPRTVVMGTPKMGLLGTLAAALRRVPRRVYVVHGLRYKGASSRTEYAILWAMEWLAMRAATEVAAVSSAVGREAVRDRLLKADKLKLVGQGSISGVDTDRFSPPSLERQHEARRRFGLPLEAPVVGYLGRLAPDKGMADLAELWERVVQERPDCWLLVVGTDECTGFGHGELITAIRGLKNVRITDSITDPETAFAAMDINVLLSKREGFGMTLIEGSAVGVPPVATRVGGIVDAVADGVTGTLVEAGDVSGAFDAVQMYLRDPEVRRQHSRAGVSRTTAEFSAKHVNQLWADYISGSD